MKESLHDQSLLSVEESYYDKYDFSLKKDWLMQVDFLNSKNTCSKPLAQSKSKFAFPFGAQISTPCTYSVF